MDSTDYTKPTFPKVFRLLSLLFLGVWAPRRL
jgi:hypothetical protein